MKIQFFTDIHNYDLSFKPEKTDADIIISSGDFDMGERSKLFFENLYKEHKKPIYSCLGNHDYWLGENMEYWDNYYNSINNDNIQILDNKTVVIDDTVLIFSTLWSDFDNKNPISMIAAESASNDFRKIRIGDRKINSTDLYLLYLKSREFITKELEKNSGKKCVVITHFPPSILCNVSFSITPLSYYFVGNMEDVIKKYKPVLWLSGHMHNFFDNYIHDTRVVINPAGNIKNNIPQNKDFQYDLVLDI